MRAFGWLKNPQYRLISENESEKAGQVWFSINDPEAKKSLKQALEAAVKEVASVKEELNQILKLSSEEKMNKQLDELIKKIETSAIKSSLEKLQKEVHLQNAVKNMLAKDGLLDKMNSSYQKGCKIDKSLHEIFQIDDLQAKNKRRCALLVKNQGKFGFIHESFFNYFVSIDTLGRREKIIERLEGDAYEYADLFRGTKHY